MQLLLVLLPLFGSGQVSAETQSREVKRRELIANLNQKPISEILRHEHVNGQLIVRLRPLAGLAGSQLLRRHEAESLAQAAMDAEGCSILGLLHRANQLAALDIPARGPLVLVEIPAGKSMEEMIKKLRSHPSVEYVEPNYRTYVAQEPNDTHYVDGKLWNMPMISAPAAWDTITDARSVRVGVIDTGVDQDHPDLAANLLAGGYDYLGNDPDPEDDNGHGSHTAGTIGAVGNNAEGVVGVAWQAQIMPIRACGGQYGSCDEFDLAGALQHAIDENIEIINGSWGFSTYYQAHYDLIDDCRQAGILYVAAAGNVGWDLDQQGNDFYPCEYSLDNIICVGKTDDQDRPDGNFGTLAVDLGAPGDKIWSCILDGVYGTKSGSSMAAPHVAGTAALIKALRPDLGYLDIKNAIKNSADLVFPPIHMGRGRLNVQAALNNLPDPPPVFTVYVDAANNPPGDGSQANPFPTVGQALAAVAPGGKIIIVGGQYPETISTHQAVTIEATAGPVTIGD